VVIFAIVVLALSWLAWSIGPSRTAGGRTRRWWTALLLSLLMIGCSSMQRVDATPEDLQAQLRAGKVLQQGHDVTIVTRDGKEVRLRFQRIENDAIVGRTQLGEEGSVRVADVTGLTTERLSVGRTAAAVGGGLYLTYVVLILALFTIAY
jgi:hypothetical protein